MNFGSYLQTLGITFAIWLPVAGCFYFAVRLGVQHGIKAFVEDRAKIIAATSTERR